MTQCIMCVSLGVTNTAQFRQLRGLSPIPVGLHTRRQIGNTTCGLDQRTFHDVFSFGYHVLLEDVYIVI